MTLSVTLAVLFAALLHAMWNAIIKRGSDPLSDMALLTLGASVLAAPGLPFVPALPAEAWPFLLLSNLIHIGYYVTLVGTYRHADFSVGYPLMRGTAPLIITLFGLVFLGEYPSLTIGAGIGLISCGVLSLAWIRSGQPTSRRAIVLALLNASLIAGYTLVDAAGARVAGSPLSYVLWMFVLEGLPFATLVWWLRRRAFVDYASTRWRAALVGGGCSALAYGIAVWAMTRAPVGAVSALRETSVVFALVIGAVVLKERLTPRRWLGAAAIVAGAATLKA